MKSEKNKKRLANLKEELDSLQQKIENYGHEASKEEDSHDQTPNFRKLFESYFEKINNKKGKVKTTRENL